MEREEFDLGEEMTLDDAVRIALRRSRESHGWSSPWYWHSPPGWAKAVKNAPDQVVARALDALAYSDRCMEEEKQQIEVLVEFQVRTMLGSEHAAQVLTEWALEHDDGSIPRIALDRYLEVTS